MAINLRQEYSKYNRYFIQIKDVYEKKPIVRESVEVLLSLLMISFLIIFALRPTAITIAELLANVNSQRDVQQRLEAKVVSLSGARENLNREQSSLVALDQAFPAKPAPDVYLRQVEGLMAKHNLSLITFNQQDILLFGENPVLNPVFDPKENENIPGTKPMFVSLTVIGSYENLLAFLEEFKTLRQIMIIDSFSFAQSATSASLISLKISGSVPYFDPEILNKE